MRSASAPVDRGERQQVRARARRRALRLHDRDEDGLRAGPQHAPVDEARRLQRPARLAADQRCASRNAGQRVALDVAPQRAIEQRVPGDAGEQRRARFDGFDDRLGRGRARGDRRHALLRAGTVDSHTGRARAEYGPLADARELGLPDHLDRHEPRERRQVELTPAAPAATGCRRRAPSRARRAARRRAPCGSRSPRTRAPPRPNTAVLLAQRDHPLHPVQQRERVALLRLDVDRLVAVDRDP